MPDERRVVVRDGKTYIVDTGPAPVSDEPIRRIAGDPEPTKPATRVRYRRIE